MQAEVAVVGAGVVGCGAALALARRGVSVALLEAEPEPGLAASGTNSGILHTGFDSIPGELETELILRSAQLRDPLVAALEVPVLRCGALMRPADESEQRCDRRPRRERRVATASRPRSAMTARSRCRARSVTDPVAYTLGLAEPRERHGAELRTSFRVEAVERADSGLTLHEAGGHSVRCRVAVNCAGLGAGEVARLAGDDSFDVYPRKGEFLVFDPPEGEPLERILLPVPSEGTKGVLVFPTIDGKVVAGPTAVDQEDSDDWSVRPGASDEILPKATAIYPPLADAEPIAAYAGLRPAGRGVNYLIGPSDACPGLVNVAAIRSTGLTASLAIAERVCAIVGELGVALGPQQPLEPGSPSRVAGPWWQRTAEYRAQLVERDAG